MASWEGSQIRAAIRFWLLLGCTGRRLRSGSAKLSSMRFLQARSVTVAAICCPALASCQLGAEVETIVHSRSDVAFRAVGSNTRDFCIHTAEIHSGLAPNNIGETNLEWSADIVADEDMSCDKTIRYPAASGNYQVTTPSSQLAPGRYRVVLYGGLVTASGEFTIGR